MNTEGYITIVTARGFSSQLLPSQILRIESRSNYSRIYFTDNRYPVTVARVLKHFETVLPKEIFIRPHRTHLVNRDFVECIHQSRNQNYLQLKNGERIAISRRKRKVVGVPLGV